MWPLQVMVGVGLIALGLLARRAGGRDADRFLWWIPVTLGVASLTVSAAQRFRPEWERAALLAAFAAIGALILYMVVRAWVRR